MSTALNTTFELQGRRTRMAILPVGATEQHSRHLPLATDTIVVETVAQRAAERLGAYCLPALPFSISHMHRGLRGTVWLRNQTLAAVIRDLAASLQHEKFSQFVLLNGHGGNFILTPIVQDLNLDFPKMIALTLDAWPPALASGIFQNANPMAHGDEFETSCLLYLREELVRREQIRDQPRRMDREMLRYVSIARLARLTHTGKPSAATADKGRRAVECMVEGAVQSIRATLRKVVRLRNG